MCDSSQGDSSQGDLSQGVCERERLAVVRVHGFAVLGGADVATVGRDHRAGRDGPDGFVDLSYGQRECQ